MFVSDLIKYFANGGKDERIKSLLIHYYENNYCSYCRKEIIDIIINQNNGSIEKIVYSLKGFKDPLVRDVKVSDYESAKRFIEKIDKNNNIKDDLNHLYKISNYREFSICAANSRTIEKIEKELSDKGFVLNE